MSDPAATHDILDLGAGRQIAYHKRIAATSRARPGVVFLSGFQSDMTGTKAAHLAAWADTTDRAFLRFDYTGHGASTGAFVDGAIGDWAADAFEAITRLTEGPQILVGSSMGGWISLLVMRRLREDLGAEAAAARIAGFVGIAAAPDFTEDSMAAQFSPAQATELAVAGRIEIPNPYADEPTVITRRLIEDGRQNLVLRRPLVIDAPVRLLQGDQDEEVSVSVALQLISHLESPDARLTLIKGADHRLSEPRELKLLVQTIETMTSSDH